MGKLVTDMIKFFDLTTRRFSAVMFLANYAFAAQLTFAHNAPPTPPSATPTATSTSTPTKPEVTPGKNDETDLATGAAPEGKVTSPIPNDWLKAVVSIESTAPSPTPTPIGTGFLMQTEKNHIIIVTAKHVITGDGTQAMEKLAYRFNNTEHKSDLVPDNAFDRRTGKWFLSEKADVACRFISYQKNIDLRTIPFKMLLRQEYVGAGTPLLVFGFPMGLRAEDHPTAIARRGTVARSDADGLLLEAFMFPGNSGGPVFYLPTISLDSVVFRTSFLNSPRLVGIVLSYIPYREAAWSLQTKTPRVVFEENSGLANAAPADAIIDLINRPDFVEFDKALPQ